jgi:hypothetical protein
MFIAQTASRRAGSSPNERLRRRMMTTIVEINPIPLAFGLAREANYHIFLAAGAHKVFNFAQDHVVSSTWPLKDLHDTGISLYGPEAIKPRTDLECSLRDHDPQATSPQERSICVKLSAPFP